MEVSVVIPVYNEEESIGQVIDSIHRVMTKNNVIYEIVVVDDGSSDKSNQIAEGKSVKIIKNITNSGYGASLKKGIKIARYNNILIIDADGTYSCDSIPDLIKYIDEADMVVGSRLGKDEASILRRIGKLVINNLANYLTDTKIPDLNSGLRIIKKDVVEKFMNILPDGFSFTTTITLAMTANHYNIRYVPIIYNKRFGKSKIRPIKDTLNFLQLIIRTVMYFNPLKVFVPLSVALFFLSLGVLVYSRFFTPQVMDITTVVLFLSSIQALIIGMIADLINKKCK